MLLRKEIIEYIYIDIYIYITGTIVVSVVSGVYIYLPTYLLCSFIYLLIYCINDINIFL
jgi:hypothetical protein